MKKIELRENKVLKLLNVLSRKVPEAELFSQDKQIQMLYNWISTKGYESIGPLIMYTSEIKGLDAERRPIIDSRVMVQLKQGNVKIELPYKFENEIRIENCLMARFNDNVEKLQFATMKLQLFAYENNIELTGETYLVLIKQEENNLLADVFMPIKAKDN